MCLYSKAAEQGNLDSQNNLGTCFYNGQGVSQDFDKAVFWFTKSARFGNPYAQLNLGNCFFKGRGVDQDYEKALLWCTKAAGQGLNEAKEKVNSIIETIKNF